MGMFFVESDFSMACLMLEVTIGHRLVQLVNRKVIKYDHHAKTSDYKFSNEFKLKTLEMNYLPKYIQENKDKYKDWLD